MLKEGLKQVDCELADKCRRLAYTRYIGEGPGWDTSPPDNWTLILEGYATDDIINEKERVYCNNFPMPDGSNFCPVWNGGCKSNCEEYEKRIQQLKKIEARKLKQQNANGRRRKWIPKATRDEVAKRAKYNCQYCGRNVNKVARNGKRLGGRVDHIVPLAQGGHETDISNLAYACHPCNSDKGDKIWELGCRIGFYDEVCT